ncbi:P-loop NTPase fold protein [Amycolatopsis sp. cmx-4-83]|uniref:P-loop NTPase fold protein n=1 Tax=Amycolatopsis sp. cmx-4-83 TaxID=2790940 RepID=UPI00397E056E
MNALPNPARRFVVLNDAPVGDGTEEDLLDVTSVAHNLSALILASRDTAPFTLAVDAAWGMGKSSLLHRLEATLSAEPGMSTVWFNAWTAGPASALEGLIKAVLLRFDRNIIRRVLRSMSRRAHLLGALRGLGLVLASFFGLGRVVDEIWQRMSLDAQARNQIKGVLRDAFGAWMAKSGTPDRRRLLVVFVDDLDRCGSERIVEVCEAIKLYLDVPGIVFVLACDQSALWRAVQKSAGFDDPAAAVEYLEKIVQITYRIAPPSVEQAIQLVDGYLHRSGTSGLFDESSKSLIIGRSRHNPRRIKRVINSFVLEYHLDPSWDEIGLAHLVNVILLQHFYPGFHSLLAHPGNDHLIGEFLDYQELRAIVKHGDQVDADRWAKLFESKGLRPPRTPDLAELESELPADYPVLAADRDFVALLRGMAQHSRVLVHRLRSRPVGLLRPPAVSPDEGDFGAPRIDGRPALRNLRVLWIDDHPSNNITLADHLQVNGVLLEQVTDRAGALASFRRFTPDVVLTDLGRGSDKNAGVTDLDHFRHGGADYRGPVLFYTGGPPGFATQKRIKQLGADGPVYSAGDVVAWLERVATAKKA